MFTTFVLITHIIVCVVLILIILLQSGKGADIGAAFGGGSSQTVFGSTGATTFLSKVTIIAAVVFMVTSFVLTYFAGKGVAVGGGSVVTKQTKPAEPLPVPVPGAQQAPGKPEGTVPAPPKEGPAGAVPGGSTETSESAPAGSEASGVTPGGGQVPSAGGQEKTETK